jgi:hypothetical protein
LSRATRPAAVVAIFACALAASLACAQDPKTPSAELARVLAKLEASGEPLDLAKLDGPPPAPEDDALPLYLEAAKLLSDPDACLAKLEEADRKPRCRRWNPDLAERDIFYKASDLPRERALALAKSNKGDEAAKMLAFGLRLGGRQKDGWVQERRRSLQNQSLSAIAQVLSDAELSEAACRDLLAAIPTEPLEPGVIFSLKEVRCRLLDAHRRTADAPLPATLQVFNCTPLDRSLELEKDRAVIDADWVAAFDVVQRGIDAAGEGLPKGARSLDAWTVKQDYLNLDPEHRNPDAMYKHAIANLTFSVLGPVEFRLWHAVDRLRRRELARAALGLRIHRLRHGAYPKKLDELVPEVLSSVPLDPLTGKPLFYAGRKSSATLWCANWDGPVWGADRDWRSDPGEPRTEHDTAPNMILRR